MEKTLKFQLSEVDHKLLIQKMKEQGLTGRGALRQFMEWICRNNFAVLDNNLKSMLKCLPLNT